MFAWFRFEWAIAIVVFALPLYVVRLSVGPLPTTVLELLILSLGCAWILKGGIAQLRGVVQNVPAFRWVGILIILFVVAALIGVFIAPDTRAALGLFRAYWIEPLLFFAILLATIRTREQLMRLFVALAISGCSIAAVAVYQRFTGWHIPMPWLSELRVTSIYPYPNAVGLYLAPIIPLALLVIREKIVHTVSQAKKILWGVLGGGVVALMVCGIIFAKTAGAEVALFITAIVVGLFWGRKMRVITLGVLLCIGILLAALPHTRYAIEQKISFKAWSGQVRTIGYRESIAMLRDHWFFGAGVGGFKETMKPYHKATAIEIFLFPHNEFLNVWSETGILGVVSFITLNVFYFYFLFSVFYRTRDPNTRAITIALGASMTIILIHGLVDVPYFKNDLAVLFWLIVASSTLCKIYSTQWNSRET